MRAKKVSWRTLQIAPTISEAIATSEAWAYVRTELQSGQIVNMRDASVATGPSELSDRHAKHLCGYKKYWSPPVELAVLPYTTVIFDGNADGYRIVFADNCVCDDLTVIAQAA